MRYIKVGIVFGCFIPLHIGHTALIKQSLKENNHTIVAVCGHENDRGKDFIPFSEREKLVKEYYKREIYNGDMDIVSVDDDKCGCDGSFTLDNWKRWSDLLFDEAYYNPKDPYYIFTWYTGEVSYLGKLYELFPFHNFLLVSRKKIDISGTEIRKNPIKYERLIAPPFVDYLCKGGIIV